MKFRLTLGLALLLANLPGLANAQQATKSSNLNDVSLEIAVLQTLHDLELTPPQLTKLTEFAKESAPKEENRQPSKTTPEFATALRNLHAAYTKGDDKQISECREKLDGLMEKQQPELDNSVVITDQAKANAAEALKVFNVRQTGAFLTTLPLTDPAELLVSALEVIRQLKNSKDKEREIASVTEEVRWLVHGLDENEASQKTKEKVTNLLQRVGKKSDDDGGNDPKSLEKEARELFKEVDNMDVIGHILEHGMAELLSNPRLEAAIGIQSQIASRPAMPKRAAPPSAVPKK
jgi:hypothetical protein